MLSRRLVDYFQFPLALLDGNARVIQANSSWVDAMNILEGEYAHKYINLSPSPTLAKTEDYWQQVASQLPEAGEKLSLIHQQPGHLSLLLSKVKFDQILFFWARPAIETDLYGDTNRLAREKRLHEMGEMAAGVAHEITNPLTVIAAKASILEYMMKEGDDEGNSEVLKITQVITHQCHRITKIVRAMRTFSRDGAFDPVVAMAIRPLIDEAITLCVEKSRLKGTKFEVETLDSEYQVMCRPIHIVQILVNLFNNAIDATDSVLLPKVIVAFQKSEDFLEIQTLDNGTGVPEEIADKIFNPFYTTKEVGKGTGLGLSLSLRLSQISGGNLFLDRKQGKSCFTLRLPLAASLKIVK